MDSKPGTATEGLGRGRIAWTLLGLLALALALRLVDYGQSIWFDEACMSKERLGSLPQLLATIYVDIHPPLYITFMYAWNAVLGDAEWSLRLVPLLAGLGGIVMTFVAGRRFVGERAALLAAALLALSPVDLWYSIEARPYTLTLLGALVLVWLCDRLLDGEGRRRTWISYAAIVFGLLWLHYYLVVYVALLALVVLVDRRAGARPGLRQRVLWIHGLGLASILAWVALKAGLAQFETSMGYMRSFDLAGLYPFLFEWCWTGNTLAVEGTEDGSALELAWLGIQGLGVLLVALGLWRILRSARERARGLLLPLYALAIPLFLLALPLVGLGGNFVERSALPSLPFLLLVAAAGVTSVPWRRARQLLGGLALLASLACLAGYFAHEDDWTVYKPHPDWRSLAAYLGEEIDAGGAGRPVFSAMPSLRSLAYYDARIQQEKNLAPTDTGEEEIRGKLVGRLGEGLGGWSAERLLAVFDDFEREKGAKRAATRLWVHHAGDGTLEGLRLDERRTDGVLYLVKNRFHPPGDTTIDALLASPRLELLEQRSFKSLTVYELRER